MRRESSSTSGISERNANRYRSTAALSGAAGQPIFVLQIAGTVAKKESLTPRNLSHRVVVTLHTSEPPELRQDYAPSANGANWKQLALPCLERKHMKKHIRTSIILGMLLYSQLSLGAFELSLNGNSRWISVEEFHRISSPRPVDGNIIESIRPEELLPICRSLESLHLNSRRITIPRQGESVRPLYRDLIYLDRDNQFRYKCEKRRSEELHQLVLRADIISDQALEIWVSWEGVDELKAEAARWSLLHNISVKVNEVPKSDSKLLSVLRGGGQPPDIIQIQSDYIPPLCSAGALQPMVRFPTDTYQEKALEAFRRDGQIWAVPFYCDSQLLFYRKDLMQGPEETGSWSLAEFEKAAIALRDMGISPASWNAYSAYWLAPFQAGFGKRPLVERDGTVRVDDGATREAVHYLKDLIDRKLLDLRERDSMFSRFVEGSCAMMLSASFSIPELERIGVPFSVAQVPRGPAGSSSPLLDVKGFAISRRSRNPLLARRFLLSLSDCAVGHRFCSALSKLPVQEEAWLMNAGENPYFPALRTAFEEGQTVPSSRGYKVYKNTMWKMLRFLLHGSMEIETGLRRAQSLIEAQMRR